jgi:hypothetical protein
LAEFVDRVLESALAERVNTHVQSCSECKQWIDTYRMIEDTLAGPAAESHYSHVSALALARSATATQDGGERDCAELQSHLENCSQCRYIVDLSRSAVLNARPESAFPWSSGAKRSGVLASTRRLALAASLIIFVVGGILGVLYLDEHDGSNQRITGVSIDGVRVFSADDTITADSARVGEGAMVTFRAGDSVAFGDGFSVGLEATVIVETTGSAAAVGLTPEA